jgi:inosine-uridine nucleoside N-ribohydrolase
MPVAGWPADVIEPRVRVVSDNDYCGDPDGLVQLAHHLLCPSVDIRLVVGSQVATYDPTWTTSAEGSVAAARRVAELTGRADVPIVAGSHEPLATRTEPRPSAAARAIVAEAMHADSSLPLFVACGGGLTSIASAWLMEPRVAERLTLVWIGGREHPGIAEPSTGALDLEYNTSIDILAAQVVFNDSDLEVWQVPRNAYRQVLSSRSEMLTRMRPHGPLGEHLFDALGQAAQACGALGLHMGETYVLGDSPLVLLTALWSNFGPSPSSSRWVVRPRPNLNDAGHYEPNPDGHPMRIFTELDTRLVLEDLYAKLQLHT